MENNEWEHFSVPSYDDLCPALSSLGPVFLFTFCRQALDSLLICHISALGLLPPRTPFVGYWVHPRMGTVGAHGGLGVTRVSFSQPEGDWFSFPPHPHHLIHWSTLLSLRIVHLLSEWTNYTGCASLLFPDLADLLFIAFPKMFAGSVPFNPASAIWHSGWNTAITKHQRPLSADHLWGRGCYTLFF